MSSDEQFLEAAASIAREIVASAVWDDGRCNWMGAVAGPAPSSRAECRALGPSLYAGTAGVGLFLANVAAATDEQPFRETSVGALRHATSRAPVLPLVRHDGFHAGTLGIAWAVASAARVLEDGELHETARAVMDHAPHLSEPGRRPDLVSGVAGSVLGLLALADELDEPRLVEDAVSAGDTLADRATMTSRGYSWAIPGLRYPAHLCGIAHGAAGIGLALLELFGATGERRFLDAATGAFDYERSWLDGERGTWPDLRTAAHRGGRLPMIDAAITGTWCYGEAGIALTRLRAIEVLGPGDHARDAEIAIDTTCRYVADSLPYAITDLSLCHGLGGAADVLQGAAVAGGVRKLRPVLVTQLGDVALERYGLGTRSWPCGIGGETTPGLFLGLCGIGWLFLRLHNPEVPSPLVPKMSFKPVPLGSVGSLGRAVPTSL